MTRKKVKLQYIINDSERKASFKKRKKGLIKKVSELSTLCGVDACAIIISPYDTEPQVWPSTLGVQRVIAKFRKLSDYEQSKNMVNQETFTREKLKKVEEKLLRQQKLNRQKELNIIMYNCLAGESVQNYNLADLSDLGGLLDQKTREISRKIESVKKLSQSQGMATMNGMASTGIRGQNGMEMGMASTSISGQNSMEVGTASNLTVNNATQDYQWMGDDDMQPGIGWDGSTMLPFNYISDSPGPSYFYP